VLATIFISIQGGVYLLSNITALPLKNVANILSLGWDEQAIGLHEGYIGMQFPGLNSLPFLAPFAIAALAIHPINSDGRRIIGKGWLYTALIGGILVALFAARRALLVTIVFAPVLTAFFLFFRSSTERTVGLRRLGILIIALISISVGAVYCINSTYQVSAESLFQRVSDGFDFTPTSADDGSIARNQQYAALLNGWFERPVLGAGLGAPAFGSIRSEERPWEYELYYFALLYQTGFFGFLGYALGVSWIFWNGIRVIRSEPELGSWLLPILVGCGSLMVANATNPYLARFDGLWAIFLPIAYINFWLLRRSGPRLAAHAVS